MMCSSVRTKTYQRDEWAAIVERGLERLNQFDAGSSTHGQLSELVVEHLLKQMVFNHDSVHDKKAGLVLIEHFFKKKIKTEFGSTFSNISQLELF